MSGGTERDARTLAALIPLGIANHGVLAGSRVVVSLNALSVGASPFTVGVLMSLYALLPMLLAVAAGRFSDRFGTYWPMQIGSAVIAVGAALPFALPGLPTLYASATLIGVGFMVFQLATQNVAGELGGVGARARNFSLLALGYSVSGFIGPLFSGFTIDHFGFRAAFAVFSLVPLIPIIVLWRGGIAIPRRHHRAGAIPRSGGALSLLRHRTLRKVFAINALLSLAWDPHSIFVPIYGEKIGLSASQIGTVLASFAAATFTIRFFMPAIARKITEQQVLTGALLVAGIVYLAFPFLQSVWALIALSFALGLGLGCGQPMVMSLLHTHSPPGRVGEAAGVRLSLVNTMSFAAPLMLGAAGASIGLAPVFWSVGACLLTSGVVSRRPRQSD